jgi:hypothetical protein
LSFYSFPLSQYPKPCRCQKAGQGPGLKAFQLNIVAHPGNKVKTYGLFRPFLSPFLSPYPAKSILNKTTLFCRYSSNHRLKAGRLPGPDSLLKSICRLNQQRLGKGTSHKGDSKGHVVIPITGRYND